MRIKVFFSLSLNKDETSFHNLQSNYKRRKTPSTIVKTICKLDNTKNKLKNH